jgi:hypothetical protein
MTAQAKESIVECLEVPFEGWQGLRPDVGVELTSRPVVDAQLLQLAFYVLVRLTAWKDEARTYKDVYSYSENDAHGPHCRSCERATRLRSRHKVGLLASGEAICNERRVQASRRSDDVHMRSRTH